MVIVERYDVYEKEPDRRVKVTDAYKLNGKRKVSLLELFQPLPMKVKP